MTNKEEKKLKKELQKLFNDCMGGEVNFDTYFYLGDIAVGEERYAHWFLNNDYTVLKTHILYLTILYEAHLPLNQDYIDCLLLKKDVNLGNLTDKEIEFDKLFKNAENTTSYDEFKEKLGELIEYINKLGVDIKVYVYKNAKEALPKALQLDSLSETEDSFCFSKLILDIVEGNVN